MYSNTYITLYIVRHEGKNVACDYDPPSSEFRSTIRFVKTVKVLYSDWCKRIQRRKDREIARQANRALPLCRRFEYRKFFYKG